MILNEEQRLMVHTVESLLKAHEPKLKLRELRDHKNTASSYDRALWQKLSELGLAGACAKEEDGGYDLGFLGFGGIIERLGYHLAATPLPQNAVASAVVVSQSQNANLKEYALPALLSGELHVAIAAQAGRASSAPSLITDNNDSEPCSRLTGSITLVPDAHVADAFIICANKTNQDNSNSEAELVWVPRDSQSIEIKHYQLMDGRFYADIELNGTKISKTNVLMSGKDAEAINRKMASALTILLASEMLGGAQACFDQTIEHLKEREQFGVKIGSFQALQHRAAQMYCDLELCRSVVLDALEGLDTGASDLALRTSNAKALANEVYTKITSEAVQLHGGMGVTDELDIGLYLKRSRVCNQLFGDTTTHKNVFAKAMGF